MKYIKTYEEKLGDFIHKVKSARQFALDAHEGQYRRGKDKDGNKLIYFTHPEKVAKIVHKVKTSRKIADLIAAAYLHDVIEDVPEIDPKTIKKEFGELVYSLVKELTSDPEELKKYGKEQYLMNKMLTMSSWGLVIKLADRLHNVSDIPGILKSEDKKRIVWAKRYANQTKRIISELENNRELSATQKRLVKKIEKKIKNAYSK